MDEARLLPLCASSRGPRFVPGDDLSIASYEDAFRAARAFFRLVAWDGLAREVLYVPGNHDFEIWHTVEYQVNVIRQIEKGRSPRPFRRAVPAVLDERPAGARTVEADPTRVVFGHTHQPIPWGSDELVDEVDGRRVRFCNTGGWLMRGGSGAPELPGAEVLLYETGRGFWSESIRATDWA